MNQDHSYQHGLSTHPDPGAPGEDAESQMPSTAPNTSFATGAGAETTGFDSPPVTSSYLSNADVDVQSGQGEPIYPPGGGPEPRRPEEMTEDEWRELR